MTMNHPAPVTIIVEGGLYEDSLTLAELSDESIERALAIVGAMLQELRRQQPQAH